ncbi:16S rRNA (cytosine(1402)-N(4))-methyltransferase RsmH [Acidiferrobacter sp.]|uniref:16S rRNA (cytosine(1402)-N(4))-methyltransferase RsmH n=1 Tax=Acidiferrobacter sp. TaxID=1872107 RepID=UPI0026280DBB|nr:16S rRNA (cytosine(1402)-N(4))-methyltransferase RsmH [Acidiferrobacter sp.]
MIAGHEPVLLAETLEALAVRPEGRYLDATFGRGGHSAEILARLAPGGGLVAMDCDDQAIEMATRCFGEDPRMTIVKGRFSIIGQDRGEPPWQGGFDGILFDLGVSSPQLDEAARGFSFRREGPLDMRMDRQAHPSAAEWLNAAPEAEIAQVLRDFGEERYARRIARAVVAARAMRPLATTTQFAALVAREIPRREPGQDPATRAFQAVRIRVNDELGELTRALPAARDLLRPGGRLVVISFHSLEDRVVKQFFAHEARGDSYPARLPIPQAWLAPRLRVLGRALRPGAAERAANPRSRSAVLRVAQRLGDPS